MAGLQFRKHLWLGFQDYATITFRALGLNIVVCWFRSFFSRKIKRRSRIERPKVAIRKHRPAAFLRALVHVLPVTGALFLVTINLYDYYVGTSIQSLVFYQFIAKVFEIMAQASLAAIVFSYIRHEMILGQGIPLGALFSGLQLSQASYLWSMEFWGSLLMGISTNEVIVPPECSVVNQSTTVSFCPSDEWQSIEKFLQLQLHSLPPQFVEEFGYNEPEKGIEITGKAAIRELMISRQLSKPFVNSDPFMTTVTAAQSAVADALTSTGLLWATTNPDMNTGGHGVTLEQLDAVHRIENNYYQPYTIGSCANDTIEGVNDERPLAFPMPPGVLPQYIPQQRLDNSLLDYPAFPFFNLTRAEILDTAGPSWENRLQWIELPQDPFNNTAIGAVILQPVQDAGVQEIIVCTLGAGWGQTTLNSSTRLGGSTGVETRISSPESFTREMMSLNDTAPDPGISEAENLIDILSGIFMYPIYPQHLIKATQNYTKYLNPFVTELNTTVFHQLMRSNMTLFDPAVTAAIILSSLLANGLSRIGIESSLQGDLRNRTDASGKTVPDSNAWFQGKGDAFVVDPRESKDWVKFKVDTTFEGYAYNSSGVGPKVAIVFLAIYCTFAIAHTCYAGISGISSSCWDSIGELIALTMNSAPSKLLRNTSSGITETNIFKLPARIFAKPDDEGEGEHLELVLGEQDEKTLEQRTLKMNRVYG
ncbi:MAG: hypothetical protein Q9212_001725 [Teloschistes hypoglaucus]